MRGPRMREELAERIANAGPIADFREGLRNGGVDLNSASTFLQEIKV